MLKVTFKKLISAFLVAVICLTAVPYASFDSFAVDGISMRLEKLKESYPHGWYYNHKVLTSEDTRKNLLEGRVEAYASSVSRYPCTDHNSVAQKGAYDCNYFDGGYQCHGFAARLFYEIFGVRQSGLAVNKSNFTSVKPGDLVRLKKDTHSAIVLSVGKDSFTVAECNVSENGQAQACKIIWGRSYKFSDITYYVRSSNYSAVQADTSWKSVEKKVNAGSSFYAAIYNPGQNKVVSVGAGSNAITEVYTVSASQIWLFTRQKNGSYKVENCKTGGALGVNGEPSGSKTAVAAGGFSNSDAQLWSIYKNGDGFYISPECTDNVLCAESTGNVCVNSKTIGSTRLFKLIKKNVPAASVIKAKGSDGYAALAWSKGSDTKSFDVEIYNASAKLYRKYTDVTALSLKASLPAGNYSARIISKNNYSQTVGNTVYFTVIKNGVLGSTAKVSATQSQSSITLSWTPVPGANGYGVFYKSQGGWKGLAAVGKTGYTISGLTAGKKYNLAIRAFKNVGGKKVWADTSAIFTAATMLKAPSLLSAVQTTDSVTLSWSALPSADGYRSYIKTASGWSVIETVSKNESVVRSLTAGTAYTVAVRAYMKTTTGVVWGELKTLSTATKPASPKLTVSDVKNLKAKIRWDKVSGADGYQVYYKLDNGQGYTHLANYKASDGGIELTKLKNGVYYTFAVRAYKRVNGKNIYGDYSFVRFQAKYLK